MWLGLLAGCAGLLPAGHAAAQGSTCATDADCMQGFVCEVTGASGCASAGFACPDNGMPCVAPPPPPPCETMELRSCVPAPCSSDADCADGMVCFAQESFDCSQVDVACMPGAECLKPAPLPCEPTTHASCVPQYVPPCQADADCGAGFRCVEDFAFTCSGSAPSSGGAPAAGGGADPVPGAAGAGGGAAPSPVPVQPPECMQTGTGTFHCEVIEVVCATDADCVDGWSCLDSGVAPVTCSSGGTAGAGAAPAMRPAPATCPSAIPDICRVCADNSCGTPECQADGTWLHVCPEDGDGAEPPPPDSVPVPIEPPTCMVDPTFVPTRTCTPPFFFGVDIAAQSAPGATGAPTAASGDPGSAPPPRADGENGAPAGEEPTGMPENEMGNAELTPLGSSKACAVRAPGSSGGSVLALGLLGLCALGLRRRGSH
jgi:hypothetical protein